MPADSTTRRLARGLVLLLLATGPATAKITQNRLYSDDMILESREAYDIRPFIAGFGDTVGEKVVVTFAHGSYPTTVGADGKWEVQMNCCDKLVDQVLTVTGEANTLNYTNVACGQVFVCSGQSNMVSPPCRRHVAGRPFATRRARTRCELPVSVPLTPRPVLL